MLVDSIWWIAYPPVIKRGLMENVNLYTMTNDVPIKTAIAKFDYWRGLFQSNCELAVRRENGLSSCQNG